MPPLLKLILRRLGLGVLTLFLVSVVVFGATQALPGDPARAILGKQAADKAMYEALRQQLHLNRPLYVQYTLWLKGVATGHLGTSTASGEPVTTLIRAARRELRAARPARGHHQHPVSLLIGALAALWRDSLFDYQHIGRLSRARGTPEFVIGCCSSSSLPRRSALHAGGLEDRPEPLGLEAAESAHTAVLTLVLAVAPYISRILRASMIEVLESDYVQMARLKGMPERTVMTRHALPNAVIPAIQVSALQLAWLAGGVVVVEYLFNYPGIGSAFIDAVTTATCRSSRRSRC